MSSLSEPQIKERPFPFRRVVVVANPVSGRGQGAKAASELVAALEERGVRVELILTSRRGDAVGRLRELGTEFDLAVSVGGDGTLREVLEGLVDPETPVGILPFGTANVLAIELGIPRDVHHALEILARGKQRSIDVARVNGRLSFLVVGVGLDGYAVQEVERRRRGPITKWSYVRAGLRCLWSYRAPALEVELDGDGTIERAGFVIVANTRQYAATLKLAPDARIDDGRYEVYLFESGSLHEIFRAFLRGLFRPLTGPGVRMRRARKVRISSKTEVPYEVDGDHGGVTPVELELLRHPYRLVVPD